MAYHNTNIWDITEEIKEINRKIIILATNATPQQREVLKTAQEQLAKWEKQHVHSIRTAFEG